ncbi:MAG: hypothetical protein FKY71_08130 [Spiribacter salinus]|uniref:Uncharacterized protein n=1 Tax=Spiribacter salinus TaxID=1335746 RepID=A0A540VS05_9GAMM|nr:MAG: hypothetical protein FKY71_08130 [Spiribacter salinus]
MSTPKPCPFCGSHWLTRNGGYIHPNVNNGAYDGYCVLLGFALEPREVAQYNAKVDEATALRYIVQDGHPVFGVEGKPATALFVNQCLAYYRREQTGE